jgi:hypothetical protein
LHQVWEDAVQEAVFGGLTVFAAGAAGEVGADDAELAPWRVETGLHPAALGVEFAAVETGQYGTGRLARIQAHTRVALLLRKLEVAVKFTQLVEAPGHVAGLGLDLLHPHTIGARVCGPFHEPLGGRRTNAIEIERDQPKSQDGSPKR